MYPFVIWLSSQDSIQSRNASHKSRERERERERERDTSSKGCIEEMVRCCDCGGIWIVDEVLDEAMVVA